MVVVVWWRLGPRTMIEYFVSILRDGFVVVVVVKKHILDFHLFDVVLEKYVLDDLLIGLVLFAELLLGFLFHDLLLLELSLVACLPCLLQASRIEQYAVRDVERVPEAVVGESKEVRKLMEGIEIMEPVGEVVHADLLRNLLRLAQLLDPDVEEFVALVREEEIVEEWFRVVTAKLHEERLLVLVVDVVHQVGDHLRIRDDDRDERHVALRRFRVGDLDAILVVLF